jgi:hypothetical protein
LLAFALPLGLGFAPVPAHAQDSQPGDAELLESLDQTRLAYVITGDDDTDETSKMGLDSLSNFLTSRTALEPGTAIGVDIETDQLALYSLIYWPMSEDADDPSPAAISRIDAYMKSGGTVLFDTRDRIAELGGGSSSLTLKMQRILANLDIPPLEPVPEDHVLTKSFFLLDSVPRALCGWAALGRGNAPETRGSCDQAGTRRRWGLVYPDHGQRHGRGLGAR